MYKINQHQITLRLKSFHSLSFFKDNELIHICNGSLFRGIVSFILILLLTFCSEGAVARKGGYFSLGEDDVMLDEVNCTGTEKSIIQCPHRDVQQTDCSDINDAGVTCMNETLKGMLCQCSIPYRWSFWVYKICLGLIN